MHARGGGTDALICRVLPSPASYTCSPGTTLFRGQYTGERGTRLISFLIYLILEKTCDKQMIRIGGGGGQQDDPVPAQVTLEKDNLSSRLNIYCTLVPYSLPDYFSHDGITLVTSSLHSGDQAARLVADLWPGHSLWSWVSSDPTVVCGVGEDTNMLLSDDLDGFQNLFKCSPPARWRQPGAGLAATTR